MERHGGFEILKKEALSDTIYLMDIKAPRVSKNCKPGQFVIIKLDEYGERIPMTICDYDREGEAVTIVFQAVGRSTEKWQNMKLVMFSDFTGPLGQPSELISTPREELEKKKILFAAGGVGLLLFIHKLMDEETWL